MRDIILKEYDLKQKLSKLRHPSYIVQYDTTLSELAGNRVFIYKYSGKNINVINKYYTKSWSWF